MMINATAFRSISIKFKKSFSASASALNRLLIVDHPMKFGGPGIVSVNELGLLGRISGFLNGGSASTGTLDLIVT